MAADLGDLEPPARAPTGSSCVSGSCATTLTVPASCATNADCPAVATCQTDTFVAAPAVFPAPGGGISFGMFDPVQLGKRGKAALREDGAY